MSAAVAPPIEWPRRATKGAGEASSIELINEAAALTSASKGSSSCVGVKRGEQPCPRASIKTTS